MPKMQPPDGSEAARRLAIEEQARQERWAELRQRALESQRRNPIASTIEILRLRALRTLDNGAPLAGGEVIHLSEDMVIRASEMLAIIEELAGAQDQLAQARGADWGCIPIDWDPGPVDGAGDYVCGQGGVCRLPEGTRIKIVLDAIIKPEWQAKAVGDDPQTHVVELNSGWVLEVGPDEIVGVVDDND